MPKPFSVSAPITNNQLAAFPTVLRTNICIRNSETRPRNDPVQAKATNVIRSYRSGTKRAGLGGVMAVIRQSAEVADRRKPSKARRPVVQVVSGEGPQRRQPGEKEVPNQPIIRIGAV